MLPGLGMPIMLARSSGGGGGGGGGGGVSRQVVIAPDLMGEPLYVTMTQSRQYAAPGMYVNEA